MSAPIPPRGRISCDAAAAGGAAVEGAFAVERAAGGTAGSAGRGGSGATFVAGGGGVGAAGEGDTSGGVAIVGGAGAGGGGGGGAETTPLNAALAEANGPRPPFATGVGLEKIHPAIVPSTTTRSAIAITIAHHGGGF